MRVEGSLTVAAAVLFLSGCAVQARQSSAIIPGGDPERGASAIKSYGCGSCHTIPGISGAHGLVGPSLDGIAGRLYIAGSLLNRPDNLVHWIRDPQSIRAGTAMPNLDVTPRDATDITTYLYSLK